MDAREIAEGLSPRERLMLLEIGSKGDDMLDFPYPTVLDTPPPGDSDDSRRLPQPQQEPLSELHLLLTETLQTTIKPPRKTVTPKSVQLAREAVQKGLEAE